MGRKLKNKKEITGRPSSRATEFNITGEFDHGYRNKEDISNLPPNVLVVGSQNVLTNASEQVVIRNGYELDGDTGNQDTYGIDSAFDFNTHLDGVRNLRKWGTNLEVRYVNPEDDTVSWVNIQDDLSDVNVVNFCEFWDQETELKNLCLFVNGDNNVYEWTGGMGSYESSTTNTIVLSGTKSLNDLNFYTDVANAGKMKLLINGVEYEYTGAGTNGSTVFSQTPVTNKIVSSDTRWNSQQFTTGANAEFINQTTVVVNALTGPNYVSANFTAGIYTDNAGVPGVLVGDVATASVPAGFSAGDFTLIFTFLQAVNPATIYHFVIYSDVTNGNLNVYTGNTPAVGTNISTNSGSTWSTQNGYLNLIVTELDTTTQTFTGVTPDPTGAGISVGDAVIQSPTIGTASIRSCTLTKLDLISNFGNQVYYGAFNNHDIFVSEINNYRDCTSATPRAVGEGATATLDAVPTAFVPQDDSMLVSAGKDYWYQSKFQLSADLSDESFTFGRLKTTGNQGAQSQALTAKMKNNVIFVSFEPIFNTLGTVKNFLNSPQTVNYSDSIKYDMDAYDFTGGSCYYFNFFLYFTVPSVSVVRLYNLQKKYWEAPQVMPISFFYQVDGQLYGHSSLTNESYQVFVPGIYNDNGNPISAIASFPYVSNIGGTAPMKKNFNKVYTEGYIAGNTALTLTVNYDFGGYSGNYSVDISGVAPSNTVFNRVTDGSLGQNTLGNQPIGQILNISPQPAIPKFRIINTMPRVNFYEYQIVYSSNEIDQNWAILRFGPGIAPADTAPVEISI